MISLLIIFASLTASLSISPSYNLTANDEWQSAVRKGTALYQQLLSGCYPDKPNPVTLQQLLSEGWSFYEHPWPPEASFPRAFADFVYEFMGWSKSTDYYDVYLVRDKTRPDESSSYCIELSPRYKLIISLVSEKEPGESVFWSDATFALWQAITAVNDSNIKDVEYIGQDDINNDFTLSVIDHAVPDEQQKVSIFTSDTEEFRALLGTPNGVGGVYLLMEHKQALGYKTISRIFVFRDEWRGPDVLYEVMDRRFDSNALLLRRMGDGAAGQSLSLPLNGTQGICLLSNRTASDSIGNTS